MLATDGAGSVMRRRMAALGLIEARESDLDHGYRNCRFQRAPEAAIGWRGRRCTSGRAAATC